MTATDLHEATELQRVEGWRLEELERAGYPRPVAEQIAARHDIDLHFAVDLLERGCPAEVAAAILL